VKRYLPLYKPVLITLIFITAASCSTYSELKISGKVLLPDENSGLKFYDTSDPQKADLKTDTKKSIIISMPRYLAKGNGFNPESYIMRKGVDETVNGNYIEAEILFNQVRENITDGSVENNLAVIYELTKRNREAHTMYTSALLKSPDNPEFRSNLLSFIKHNKFTREK